MDLLFKLGTMEGNLKFITVMQNCSIEPTTCLFTGTEQNELSPGLRLRIFSSIPIPIVLKILKRNTLAIARCI